MGLFLSTTGSNVSIPELGITIAHPTTDLNIGAQFSAESVKNATSLTTAIQAGTLVWRRTAGGSAETAAQYDPDFLDMDQESGLLYSEQITDVTNTSTTTFVTATTISPGTMVAGRYRLQWSMNMRVANANRSGDIRIRQDGADLVILTPFIPNLAERAPVSGFEIINVTAGSHTYTIEFRVGAAGNTTVTLAEVKFQLERVA